MMKKVSFPKTVSAYLAALPPAERRTLQRLRKVILSTASMAEERISYGIPAYKYHGPLVFFAAFKNDLGFYGVNKTLMQKFFLNLQNFKCSGSTIRFSPKNPLPAELVKQIVRARMEQNEARMIAKRKD